MCCKINYLEGSKSTLWMCIKLYSVYGNTFYMIIGSVVFQVMFSERETKCPRLKEKIYKPRGFDSIKNTTGESWLCVLWQAGGRRSRASLGTASQAQLEACGHWRLRGNRAVARTALPLPSDPESLFLRGGNLNFISFSWSIFSPFSPWKNLCYSNRTDFFYFHTENPLNSLVTEPALALWHFLSSRMVSLPVFNHNQLPSPLTI